MATAERPPRAFASPPLPDLRDARSSLAFRSSLVDSPAVPAIELGSRYRDDAPSVFALRQGRAQRNTGINEMTACCIAMTPRWRFVRGRVSAPAVNYDGRLLRRARA